MPARFDQPEEYWSKLKTAVREEGGVSTAVLDRDGRVLKLSFAVKDDEGLRVKGGTISLEASDGVDIGNFAKVMQSNTTSLQAS